MVIQVLGLILVLVVFSLLPFWALAAFMDRAAAATVCWLTMAAYLTWLLITQGSAMVPAAIGAAVVWSGLLVFLAGGSVAQRSDAHRAAEARAAREEAGYREWVSGFDGKDH